ncbi:unnamed protein product [Blepharisma stoltei]|uniref:Rab-GAP TBC domain-containing protein n=1 Tax=Blepharisma stoltei TaxID=1481888 RepID=A0AAU9IJE4_9CILI|nr:unnamed protein product [Blepharisma stoltei]
MDFESYKIPEFFLQKSIESLNELTSFFKGYRHVKDSIAVLFNDIAEDLDVTESSATISFALAAFNSVVKSISSQNLLIAKKIDTKFIEALELFKESFSLHHYSLIEKGKKAAHKLTKARENVYKMRNEYLKAHTKQEKAEIMLNLEHEKKRMELAALNAKEMKTHAEVANENYFASLAEERKQWTEYDIVRRDISNSLKANEESRLIFIKGMIEKFAKTEQQHAQFLNKLAENVSQSLSEISIKDDLNNFEKDCLGSLKEVPREEWITYEGWKAQMKEKGQDPLSIEDSYISSNIPYEPMQDNVAIIKSKLYAIIPRERKKSADFYTCDDSPMLQASPFDDNGNDPINEIIRSPEGRIMFCEILETRKYSAFIEPYNIVTLSTIVNSVLENLNPEIDSDIVAFYKIVILSHNFYTLDGARSYLFKFLANDKFQDRKIWSKTIDRAINSKIITENENFHRNKKKLRRTKKKWDPYYKKFSIKTVEKSSASQILNEFIFYMINLNTDCDIATNLIMEAAKKSGLEKKKVLSILYELHGLKPGFTISERGYAKSIKERTTERAIWGENMFIGLTLDFLTKNDYFTLLEVCKSWNIILKAQIYKKALLEDKIYPVRKLAWKSLLYHPRRKYSEVLEHLHSNRNSIKELEDVISMDMLRTYSGNSRVNSDIVKQILRAYACYRIDIGYCQGMNYIAGTLYSVFQDEETTFWCLDEMIRNMKMEDLYSQDLPKLKYFFFSLDRLISLISPDTHLVFNSETINSSHYSSSWFITIFAGLLNQRPALLLQLWDQFLYKGWKIILKASILIIEKIKPLILNKKFEEIMTIMMSISFPTFQPEVFNEKFINDMMKIKVTNRMLIQLRKEFESIQEFVDSF